MNDRILYGVLGRPVVTEKTTVLRDQANKVAFRVHLEANKGQIREAVEKLFFASWDRKEKGSPVKAVHTLRVASKPKRVGRVVGRRAGWKKAIITLADGASIEFYETEAKTEGQGE